jgi:hypothetical protein
MKKTEKAGTGPIRVTYENWVGTENREITAAKCPKCLEWVAIPNVMENGKAEFDCWNCNFECVVLLEKFRIENVIKPSIH